MRKWGLRLFAITVVACGLFASFQFRQAHSFDPAAWRAVGWDDRIALARDFAARWPWSGAQRHELVAWLGEPADEAHVAEWVLDRAGAAPGHGRLSEETPHLWIRWHEGESGAEVKALLHRPPPISGVRTAFSPESWATGDPAERAFMLDGLRRALNTLPVVDIGALVQLLGPPSRHYLDLEFLAGAGLIDSFYLTIRVEDEGASEALIRGG